MTGEVPHFEIGPDLRKIIKEKYGKDI